VTTWLSLAQAATGGGGEGYLVYGFALLAATIVLLFLELFLPSGGLVGMLAGVAAIASVVAFFQYSVTAGLLAAGGYIVLTPIAGIFVFKFWINSPLGRRMILGGDDDAIDPDADPMDVSEQARRERLAQLRALIGARGVTVTSLRPVGTVKINDQRLDAMAEHGVIDAGMPIVVTDVYDNQIKVRPA
jgi:membrane-bound ClpP family serine protease